MDAFEVNADEANQMNNQPEIERMSVTVTEKAAKEVQRFIDEGEYEEGACLRISVSGGGCLLYTSPSPRDGLLSRMPSSA